MITGLHVSTQLRRAAGNDRAYGAALNRTQAMAGAVGAAMRTQDIGELHLKTQGAAVPCSLTVRGRSSHQIQR